MSAPLDILTAQLGAEQARAVLEVLNLAGWVVVPQDPTGAMLNAGENVEGVYCGPEDSTFGCDPEEVWRAMIAAVDEKPES